MLPPLVLPSHRFEIGWCNNNMKLCAACNQTLPRENFSKKQWQMKQKRRCKECIANNREANFEAADDAPPSGIAGEGEAASGFTDEDIFKQPPPEMNVTFACYPCRSKHHVRNINHAVGKICALAVFTQLIKQMIVACVHFAGLLKRGQMGR